MRVVITGSFSVLHPQTLTDALAAADLIGIAPTFVMTAEAAGADELALQWAQDHGVPFAIYLTERGTHGEDQILARGDKMLTEADALVVLKHASDVGHLPHLIEGARLLGLPTVVWKV